MCDPDCGSDVGDSSRLSESKILKESNTNIDTEFGVLVGANVELHNDQEKKMTHGTSSHENENIEINSNECDGNNIFAATEPSTCTLKVKTKCFKYRQNILERNNVPKTNITSTGAPLNPSTELPVYFDLETSGLDEKCNEILQIAAKYEDKTFEMYINPTMPIPPEASEINKLTNVNGYLHFEGELVASVPLITALKQFKTFLQSSNKLCVLVAHKCTFDKKFLLKALAKTRMTKEFRGILHGFVDTLPIFQKRLGRKYRCSLGYLAKELNLSTSGAHNAIADVMLLEQVLKHRGITNSYLLSEKKLWQQPKRTHKKV